MDSFAQDFTMANVKASISLSFFFLPWVEILYLLVNFKMKLWKLLSINHANFYATFTKLSDMENKRKKQDYKLYSVTQFSCLIL